MAFGGRYPVHNRGETRKALQAAPPPPANGTAAPIPSSGPIYRAQYLSLYWFARCSPAPVALVALPAKADTAPKRREVCALIFAWVCAPTHGGDTRCRYGGFSQRAGDG